MVINNAGVLAPGPVIDHTADQMKAIYFSILRVSQAVVPHMAKRKQGLIINVGLILGEFPAPWTGIYYSSKAAVRIMSEVLAMECRLFNIHVTPVAPGAIKSKIIGKQDNYQLPSDSIYGGFFYNIRDRLEAARGSFAMPSEAFAEEIISKSLSRNLPSYILTGGKSYISRIMAYLPRSWYLSYIWNMFSKPASETTKRGMGWTSFESCPISRAPP